MRIDLLREADRGLDRLARLARQAQDERAVDRDAERARRAGEVTRAIEPRALAHVVEDRLAARLIADEQKSQAVVAKDLETGRRHVRLGVAGPRHAEATEPP